MMKAIYEGYDGKKNFLGFCPDYMWKAVSYFGAPKKFGRYLVMKKDGVVREMMCTGLNEENEKARQLFRMAADSANGNYSDAYIDDREMTDTDLMEIYRSPWGRWYEVSNWYEYEDCHSDIILYTRNSDEYPLYFLDLNLENTITLDENGEIAGADGTLRFVYSKEGNLVMAKKEGSD